MKIALLAPLVTPIVETQRGGSQSMVVDLARALGSRGHHVAVFASLGSRIEGVDIRELPIDSRQLQSVVYRPGNHSLVTGASRTAFKVAYEHIAMSFDVIHSHAFDPPAIDAAPTGAPLVHTLHLPPTEEMTVAIKKRQQAQGAMIVCVSKQQAMAWRETITVHHVVRNGVPTGLIPWRPTSDGRLTYVGRLSPEKGAHIAIAIARATGLPIDVVGDAYDPDYVRDVIAPMAGGDVNIMGPLERSKVWELMSRAAAVVVPSLWDEPFGMVAAEAQAAGAPVIATRRGALIEIVEEGMTGAFIDPGDMARAPKIVAQAMNLDREAIRHSAVERLDIDGMVDGYESVYRAAAAKVGVSVA
ncbi:MAG: glycosyltransferase [Actinomycetota bacterium]